MRDLSVVYPARRGRRPARAVDGVNLRIGRGEIVALIGESGCGKSTLARTLVGLIRPTSGQVLYQGTPLGYSGRALKRYRRHVQLVLQDPGGALNPKQNVYDAVAEGPRIHRLTERLPQTVHDALANAGLRPPEDFVARYPHELSGGQQQRVVIAGAMALSPSVLVADEPVASLDASVRGEILKLLLGLRDGFGLSALVVSHDLGLAWNIADRVAVMYLGRVVEQGPVEQVLLRPRHPYTRALLSVIPDGRPDWRPTLLAGEPPDPTAVPSGCRFHPRCPRWAEAVGERRAEAACDRRELPVLTVADGDGAAACHLLEPTRLGEGMTLLRPPALRPGDTVAVICGSSPVRKQEQLESGLRAIESVGLKAEVFATARDAGSMYDYLAADDAQRGADLTRGLADPRFDAVFLACGGYGMQRTLESVDWNRIDESKPKVVVGYSDVTALLEAIAVKLGWVSLFGPMVACGGFWQGPDEYDFKELMKLLFTPESVRQLSFPGFQDGRAGHRRGHHPGRHRHADRGQFRHRHLVPGARRDPVPRGRRRTPVPDGPDHHTDTPIELPRGRQGHRPRHLHRVRRPRPHRPHARRALRRPRRTSARGRQHRTQHRDADVPGRASRRGSTPTGGRSRSSIRC